MTPFNGEKNLFAAYVTFEKIQKEENDGKKTYSTSIKMEKLMINLILVLF